MGQSAVYIRRGWEATTVTFVNQRTLEAIMIPFPDEKYAFGWRIVATIMALMIAEDCGAQKGNHKDV